MSLPAVELGLDLDERVVRRHVAKLEATGWLLREPWIWGEGSIAWLSPAGIQGAGLGGVRPMKSPPGATTISHGVLVGWSAARLERRGRIWKAARELAVDRERWAVRVRCGRGYTEQLPDLAGWLAPSTAPVAVVVESGGRREDRQKMMLEGWRDAILAGRYAAVRYDCASVNVARWINRLARKAGLAGPAFAAVLQPSAEEIAALSPAADDSEAEAEQVTRPEIVSAADLSQLAATSAPIPTSPPREESPEPRSQPEPEDPEAAAKRQRVYNEIFGIDESKRRRPWRR